MESKANILIVSDEPFRYEFLNSPDIADRCRVFFCGKKENILSLIKVSEIKIVIMELNGDGEWESETLKFMKAYDPMVDVIVIGPPLSSEEAMDWINHGATDYLIKPLQMDTFQLILQRLYEKRNLRRETHLLEKKLEKKYIFKGMVGKSPFMLEIFSLIENITRYFSTVLITGDTGTGKEMVARAIHNLCPVKNKSFIVSDCTSMPENLFESELFGYVKGAFTGADRDKKGLFEEAHEGIIFLDEIGDIPVSIQAKLLRVLENHQFRPLGSNLSKKIDVRVIAATNQDLREGIKKGTFREDLFHRLNKVEIQLPPLKNRSEDILLLVRCFLDKFNKKFDKKIRGVTQQVQKLFLTYEWPGNVRELKNTVESTAMLCKKEFIDVFDLPRYLQKKLHTEAQLPHISKDNLFPLQNLEKEYISYLLKKNKNNIRKTARILDISRTTLYSKLRKYSLANSP